MRNNQRNLSGQKFGLLLATSFETRVNARPLWTCICDCGNVTTSIASALISGKKKSCGCANKAGQGVIGSKCANYKHGGASRGKHTKEYKTWSSMIRRCELKSQVGYENYGGRGICVCDEWRNDFSKFLNDMGSAPSKHHTIDRIDVNGNYEPGNVRWATMEVQHNNRTNNAHIIFNNEVMTISQWAKRLGIKYQTLWARINVYKWPVEKALYDRP